MYIPLKQLQCNDCGKLSDVLDIDAKLPKGWLMISKHTHYCDKCESKHIHEQEE